MSLLVVRLNHENLSTKFDTPTNLPFIEPQKFYPQNLIPLQYPCIMIVAVVQGQLYYISIYKLCNINYSTTE